MKKAKITVFALEFEGIPRSKISSISGYAENSINSYLARNGKWRSEYESWAKVKSNELFKLLTQKICIAKLKALEVQVDLLDNPNPSLRLKASKEILNNQSNLFSNCNNANDEQSVANIIWERYRTQ